MNSNIDKNQEPSIETIKTCCDFCVLWGFWPV